MFLLNKEYIYNKSSTFHLLKVKIIQANSSILSRAQVLPIIMHLALTRFSMARHLFLAFILESFEKRLLKSTDIKEFIGTGKLFLGKGKAIDMPCANAMLLLRLCEKVIIT